ncbi:MAG: pirin family protein [Dehalococcoidales bacterium]|nr:pirin family protein [Dehalococcoidales bacterium]
MSMIRKVKTVFKSKPTVEGAGVHLNRAFGFNEAPSLDPFLLLDSFRSSNPADYVKGFPWHPHRGIETITYVLRGEVEHGDSMGNKGIIRAGDVQWMTAGSGIIHQEMPRGEQTGLLWGFQLWANLPAANKMMEPRYREIKKENIPEIVTNGGAKVKIICGGINGVMGPVKDIVSDPEYLDISIPVKSQFRHNVKRGHKLLAYVIEGAGRFDDKPDSMAGPDNLVIFDDGDEVVIRSDDRPLRFLLISGEPIEEPVAWYGPIVMNTQAELEAAFEEYDNGTFIKHVN